MSDCQPRSVYTVATLAQMSAWVLLRLLRFALRVAMALQRKRSSAELESDEEIIPDPDLVAVTYRYKDEIEKAQFIMGAWIIKLAEGGTMLSLALNDTVELAERLTMLVSELENILDDELPVNSIYMSWNVSAMTMMLEFANLKVLVAPLVEGPADSDASRNVHGEASASSGDLVAVCDDESSQATMVMSSEDESEAHDRATHLRQDIERELSQILEEFAEDYPDCAHFVTEETE